MKIYYYILIGLLMAAVSCSSADEPEAPSCLPVETAETCELVVSLQAETPVANGSRRSASDPTWGEPYPAKDGLPDESRIDNLYLYLVTSDGNIFPLMPVSVGAEDGVSRFKATVDLRAGYVWKAPDGTPYMSARIVAMANLPEGMPASPFTFSPTAISRIVAEGVIPMWGVTTVNDLKLEKEATVEVPQVINMLRSVPKFTFQLDDAIAQDYVITDVASPDDGFELTTYCQPRGGESALYTTSLSVEGCFKPANGQKGRALDFHGVGTDEVWFYTGERSCSPAEDGLPPFFYVTVALRSNPKVKFTGKVYMCDYNNGTPNFATSFKQIVRNHDYQYVISLAELEFVVSFREWKFGGKVHIQL